MSSPAQLMAEGPAQCSIPDLGGISLRELAGMASDGDGAILGLVARMTDGLESPPLVPAMIFNSAI
jgi:hypothetical protein